MAFFSNVGTWPNSDSSWQTSYDGQENNSSHTSQTFSSTSISSRHPLGAIPIETPSDQQNIELPIDTHFLSPEIVQELAQISDQELAQISDQELARISDTVEMNDIHFMKNPELDLGMPLSGIPSQSAHESEIPTYSEQNTNDRLVSLIAPSTSTAAPTESSNLIPLTENFEGNTNHLHERSRLIQEVASTSSIFGPDPYRDPSELLIPLSPSSTDIIHDRSDLSQNPTTDISSFEVEANIPNKTSKLKKTVSSKKNTFLNHCKLIQAILKYPKATHKELANLESVPYAADSIKKIIQKMRRQHQNGSFVSTYLKSNHFTQEDLERFAKFKSSKTDFDKRCKLIQAILKYPKATYKKLAKLDSVPYSVDRIGELISIMRKEHQNGSFVKNYLKSNLVTQEELERFAKLKFSETTFDKHCKLIQAILKNPKATHEELANLDSVTYTARTIESIILKMNKLHQHGSFVSTYLKSNLFTQEELERFAKLKLSETTFDKHCKLIQTILTHPKATLKELANLDSVLYSFNRIGEIISNMRTEHQNGSFFEKYLKSNLFTQEELERFVKLKLSETIPDGHYDLIRTILKHPKASYRDLGKLDSISYATSTVGKIIRQMRKLHKNGSFISTYLESNHLTREQLERFAELKLSETIPDDHYTLIQAILKNPKATHEELANLDSVHYSFNRIEEIISHMRRQHQNGSFVSTYLESNHMTQEDLERFAKLKLSETIPDDHYKLIQAILKNPKATHEELAKLDSISYTASNIKKIISHMRRQHQNDSFVNRYLESNHMTQEDLERFAKLKLSKTIPDDHYKLIQAILKNPKASYKKLANLDSISYTASNIASILQKMHKLHQNGSFFKKYLKSNHMTQEDLEHFVKLKLSDTIPDGHYDLIRTILNHPKASYRDLGKLDSILYATSTVGKIIRQMRKLHKNGSFISTYLESNHLTREQLERFAELKL